MMSTVNSAEKLNGNGQHKAETGPVFTIHNLYLKDLSFEAPHSPVVFSEEWKPKLDFDLQTGSLLLSETESIYEVVLHITVTIKLGEGDKEKTACLIDIQQAGAFTLQGFPEDILKQVLATACPNVLFPYAREVISSLATRGGFPQLVLPPINFDAMYAHHLENEKTGETKSEPSLS
jgi:preprotein translocase subunit SecB